MTPVAAFSARHPEECAGPASHAEAAACLPFFQAQAEHFPETLHPQREAGKQAPQPLIVFLSFEVSTLEP